MQLQRFHDVQEFCHQVQPYLLQYEAEHNLMLGILHTLLHYPTHYPEPPYLAIVQTNQEILAVAVRTPPYKVTLSKTRDLAALQLIAQDLQDEGKQLPGVSGLVPETAKFVEVWHQLTGKPYQLAVDMRIHQLTQVEAVAIAPGYLRRATDSDRPLLLQWATDFVAEIGDGVRESPARMVDSGLNRHTIYLWEDGVPVSWASGSEFIPTMARIGPVYTPPLYRRQGYATACVANLSQQLLAQGCDRCFLFTDLANPTSNHIYQQIGYRPVCDWHDYSFT